MVIISENQLKTNQKIFASFFDKRKNCKEYKKYINSSPILSEEDFNTSCDTRVIHSGVEDIYGGDNFNDYLSEYFGMIEIEEIY